MSPEQIDIGIIGGGFFGCCIGLASRAAAKKVVILEKAERLLEGASYTNQARLHTGYHYPRAMMTAYRSFANFPRFCSDFGDAVVDDFAKLYAIARRGSKVGPRTFLEFFQRMRAPIEVAPDEYRDLFESSLIAEVFLVQEHAFDASILRELMAARLDELGVEVRYATQVERVLPGPGGRVILRLRDGSELEARQAISCTYAETNPVLDRSGLPNLPLKHELAELSMVEVPDPLKSIGITVLDGPFFSVMPFPARQCHSLTHVRYTPHGSWTGVRDHDPIIRQARSKRLYMLKDAQRYVPALAECSFKDSLFAVKTVLLQNEADDGRPILYQTDHGIPNFSVVLGGKLDNVYDVIERLARTPAFAAIDPGSWSRPTR